MARRDSPSNIVPLGRRVASVGGNGNGADFGSRLRRLDLQMVQVVTLLDDVATREDLANFRVELLKAQQTQTRWLIGVVLASVVAVAVALIRTFAAAS